YWAALGVWVVRESVRKTLNKCMKFDNKREVIESAKKIGEIKYNFPVDSILQRSKLLNQVNTQKNLGEWF
ncbi:unnamed protein product, partial [marine sediment metagenome]